MKLRTWEPIKSKAIRAVSYDKETSTLFVVFTNSKTYKYFDVTREEYFELLSADSVGQHFNKVIKPDKVGEQWV